MGRKARRKLYQFVDAVVEIGAAELTRSLGVEQTQAVAAMREIARGICFRYARTIIYVPVDLEFELSQRDQQIWQEYGQPGPDGAKPYTPARIAQLGEQYKLTVAHLYQIVKVVQQRELAARQPALFPDDQPA